MIFNRRKKLRIISSRDMYKRRISNMKNAWLARALSTILCLVLVFSVVGIVQADDGGKWSNPYLVRTFVDEQGREIAEISVPGRPPEIKAPVASAPEPNPAMGTNSLSNVPAFNWCYGCSATSAAMMMGYYDNTGYGNMYAGPTNGGVCPMDNSVWGPGIVGSDGECPLSATHQGKDGRTIKGHVDDYWVDYLDPGPDPFIGSWAEHTHGECTGDYMGTNQSLVGNVDGETLFYWYTDGDPLYDFTLYEPAQRDGCHGMRLFAESRGYTVNANFSQLIKGQGTDPNKGFTFADFKAEIDAGRPVLIQVEGHTMLGYGYNDPDTVYLHDTWDYSDHSMTWGGSYEALQHVAVTVIQLESAGEPDITVSPPSFEVTLPPDTVWSDTLDIGNTGGGTLTYDISDVETTGGGGTAGGEDSLWGPGSMVLEIPLECSPVEPENAAEAQTGWQNIMTDGFEGAFPGVWDALISPGFTNAYWGKDNYNPHTGSYSAFCAKSGPAGVDPPNNYPNNMEAWMIYGLFSLEDAIDAELNFYYWLDSEYEYDYLWCVASIDETNWYGWWYTGNSGGWASKFFDLTDVYTLGNLCGQPEVWIAFIFESDYMITDKGAFIDDVVLRKYTAGGPADCPWLDEDPKCGSVPPGCPADSITVSINTAGLTEGDYHANIVIDNNDPDEDPTIVPVTLHVEAAAGEPDITVDPTSFEVTLPPDADWSDTLDIGNVGGEALTYTISDEETTGMGAPAGNEKLLSQPASVVLEVPLEGALVGAEETGGVGNGWQDIMTEDFEGAFPGTKWVDFLRGAVTCTPEWVKDDQNFHGGSYSGWYERCTIPGNGGIAYGPFDLSDATDAELNFYYFYDLQECLDPYGEALCFGWGASVGASIYTAPYYFGGESCAPADSGGWQYESFDLANVPGVGDLCGQSQVWIWFWAGNGCCYADTGQGAFIDDVVLRKYTTGGADCPWLDEDPKSGMVAPGDPADSITVSIDTTGLGSTYTANIVISSNDPVEPEVIVPVTLHVSSANSPPNTPSNPSPADDATGVSINADLSWTGGDPDVGDTVTYDVHFGTSVSPPLVSNDQSATSYDPGTLNNNTKYYWKIVATDNHAAFATGPLWDFTTEAPAPEVQVSIDAPDEVAADSEFVARVIISQVENFDSCDYDLTYDPSVIEVTDVTNGLIDGTEIPVGMWGFIPPGEQGTIRVIENVPGVDGVTGEGYLAEIHFHVLGEACNSSELDLHDGKLTDNMAGDIPAEWIDGSVHVSECLPGDVNMDGRVNSADITKVERIMLMLDSPTPCVDVNGDGRINSADITKIERIMLQLD